MITQSTRKDYFEDILNTQYDYQSTAANLGNHKIFKASWINTKLGIMLAVADDQQLYLLEFMDSTKLEQKIKQLIGQFKAGITFRTSDVHELVQNELNLYFVGKLNNFTIPFMQIGTEFQKSVWQILTQIHLGEICSYIQLAKNLGKDNSFRAVANAIGSNKLMIIVPCHRVVGSNNKLGGYSGGIINKQLLLAHEQMLSK